MHGELSSEVMDQQTTVNRDPITLRSGVPNVLFGSVQFLYP